MRSTCIIVPKPISGKYQWIGSSSTWEYDGPGFTGADIDKDIWANNRALVWEGTINAKRAIEDTFRADLTKQGRKDILDKIDKLDWPQALGIEVATKFPSIQSMTNLNDTGSGYYLGQNVVGTAGHCVTAAIDHPNEWMVVFGWQGAGTLKLKPTCCDIVR